MSSPKSSPPHRHRLIALDADDLAVISAHLQDAEVRAADILWRAPEKRLVIGLHRLDWDQALDGALSPRRLAAALRFDRVLACQARDIDPAARDAELYLIGIEFHQTEAPGGRALLLFSSGAMLRLDVECVECELADLDPDEAAAPPP
ncbi:MAG: DUF2948 family protein [Xanthobacteraceae bacterium]